MKPRILLVNPPIYDFAAYDFWLKPYGLLEVAGFLRGQAEFHLFDYLDRLHPSLAQNDKVAFDQWGRGSFSYNYLDKPKCLQSVLRRFRRFGLERELFQQSLRDAPPYDSVIVQTMMTYWYPGVQEVIEDIRQFQPSASIVLGGNYATLCPQHAASLGPDLIISGMDLDPLWHHLQLTPDVTEPALWEVYEYLQTGVLKLTQGCPFQCSYCAVKQVYGPFVPRSLSRSLRDYQLLHQSGVTNIAFYDDALLYHPQEVLIPFLEQVIDMNTGIHLHSPNALNARFLTAELAQIMVKAGFKTFYLGFESASEEWQKATGGKVHTHELAQAVNNLREAGVPPHCISAYQILGHPQQDLQELEQSIRFVHSLGIRGTLADFTPIPGTPDGEACSQWVDISEPLMHNKTAFPILLLGFEEVNRFKNLQKQLNRTIGK